LICEYGDETFVAFNIIQDLNNPIYKKSYGKLPLNLTINENKNIPDVIDSNRYILANTEFGDDVLIKSIDILPSKIGLINLWMITFTFECNITCYNDLNQMQMNQIKLEKRYKLTASMTLELKNLSMHTFYFSSDIPLERGLN
jgi:hypothetical protein